MVRIRLRIHPLYMMIRIFIIGILAVTLGALILDIMSLLADTNMTLRKVAKALLASYGHGLLHNIYRVTSFVRIVSQ